MAPGQTDKFLVNPFIVSEEEGKKLKFFLPYFQLTFSGPRAMGDLIERLQEQGPISRQELIAWIDPQTFAWLVGNYLLMPESEVEVLKYGVFNLRASVPPGKNLLYAGSHRPYTLIGLPFHTNLFGSLSTQFGPELVRNYLRGDALPPSLQDAGDIIFLPHAEALTNIQPRLQIAIQKCIDGQTKPVFIGGDHSLTYYTFQEVSRHHPDLKLIQIDAHSDLQESKLSMIDHLTNANFARKLIEKEALDKVVQIGVRDTNAHIPQQVEQLTLQDAKTWLGQQKGDSTPAYLSIDIDCIDPLEAPEVNHPLKGGLRIDELTGIIKMILQNCNVVAIDIMEIGSTGNPNNRAAAMAVRTLQALNQ